MKNPKNYIRYSQAFKQKVVSEIERGKLGINEAKKLYDIKGDGTIQIWLRKLGKAHLLNKVIHIQMKDEKDRIKELQREKETLESALAQAHLKIITLESTVKVLEEKTAERIKKRTDTRLSNTLSGTKDSKKADIE
jgi:transposase-like protein